ncbi:MAG: penicillin-binding protein activator LpoB [Treponema sp.]|jgi:hypothetical protein|nr:penicillin-binding protein activator LpoB [Treponema sp.]
MKNRTKFTGIIVIRAIIMVVLVIGLGLAGCATYVPIQSVRSPTIDTSGIQRLGIKAFENHAGGSAGSQIAQYLSDKTKQEIMTQGAGHFTIISPDDPNVEGVFTGTLRNINSKDDRTQTSYKDKDGNTRTIVTYSRTVTVDFQYSVVSSRTKMEIGVVTKQDTATSTSSESSGLTDVVTLAKRAVDRQLRNFSRDIIPTIVSTNVKLMDETSSDKVIKDRMKMTKELVKGRQYDEAIRQYDDIGSPAAKANANILRQAIESAASAEAEMAELMSDTGGLIEKATEGVINSINANLPAGTTIILMKTQTAHTSLLDNAMNKIEEKLVAGKNIKLVDRQNQSLINAEVQYQMSGNVSDDSYVSIGQQLGAQYIVLCWIIGDMSERRLNIRVLNLETAQIVDQKNFEI